MKKVLHVLSFIFPGLFQMLFAHRPLKGISRSLVFFAFVSLSGYIVYRYYNFFQIYHVGIALSTPYHILVLLITVVASLWIWLFNFFETYEALIVYTARDNQRRVVEPYQKGRILYLKGELKGAQREFKKALSANSEDMDSLYQLGRVFLDRGKHKKASRVFQRYVGLAKGVKWREEVEAILSELGEKGYV